MTIGIADQASPHHIPAADSAHAAYTLIVGTAKPDFAFRAGAHALGKRRPAILEKGRRIEHAVIDRFVFLTIQNSLAHLLSMQLQSDIRLSRRHAVPSPISHHA